MPFYIYRGIAMANFLKFRDGDDEVLVDINAVMHVRYRPQRGENGATTPASLTLWLGVRAMIPHPTRPNDRVALNQRMTLHGEDAVNTWRLIETASALPSRR